ncbi:MAG: hypothetical protein ACTSQD_07700, partial [Promethearchaeota archaeon]
KDNCFIPLITELLRLSIFEKTLTRKILSSFLTKESKQYLDLPEEMLSKQSVSNLDSNKI